MQYSVRIYVNKVINMYFDKSTHKHIKICHHKQELNRITNKFKDSNHRKLKIQFDSMKM